ncbi:MAG: DNA-processing protein DprA [Solirubrobacterales bacterium]
MTDERAAGAAGACGPCLRRLQLIGTLTPFIERVATGELGKRSPQLLSLSDAALARAVGGRKAERLLADAEGADLAPLRERLRVADCWLVCRHRDGYPEGLRHAGDAPPALVGRGDPRGLARLRPGDAVTIVGARRATSYGRDVARRLAAELCGAGFTVVSGLAWGIDGAAHEGALQRGFTAAVLGCGADVAYPRHHQRLYERIRERGLILSELPPGTEAWRWAFPARNRIMAALGTMTIVVEAAGRSGSLITADLASQLGREVGAVPGPVGARMSAGTNDLIADGARLVRDAQDVLDALVGPGGSRSIVAGPPLESHLAAVLERVEAGDTDSDAIAVALDRGAGEVTACLARLEILGYLRRNFAGAYSRTPLPRPEAAVEAGDLLA